MIYAPTYKIINDKIENVKDGDYLVTYLSCKMTKKGNMVGYFDIKDGEKIRRLIAPPFLYEEFERRHYSGEYMKAVEDGKIYVTIEKGEFILCQKD